MLKPIGIHVVPDSWLVHSAHHIIPTATTPQRVRSVPMKMHAADGGGYLPPVSGWTVGGAGEGTGADARSTAL